MADPSDISMERVLVRAILEHAGDFPWKVQELGLLGLWLDARKEYRLHLWDPASSVGEPPVHDHPFDFTSTVIAGQMTNTRYAEDPLGVEYHRMRYTPPEEDAHAVDTIRLSVASTETLGAGEDYLQAAHELHDSRQVPGTVTIIRMDFKPVMPELTVCLRDGTDFISGQSCLAAADEVKRITGTALDLFD
jgi:hypothetical protein